MNNIIPVPVANTPNTELWLAGGGKRIYLGTFTNFGNLGGIPNETMMGILRLYSQIVRPHADVASTMYFKNLDEAIVLLQTGFVEFLLETSEIFDTVRLPPE
jgi:hypothetical protein